MGNIKCNICESTNYNLYYTENGYDLVKCSDCSLIYMRNPPTEEELKEIYSFNRGYHTAFRDDDELIKDYEKRGIEKIKIVENYVSSGAVLDIGCSAGFFLKAAKERGFNTYGIELSPDTADIAKGRYGLNVKSATIENASFEDDFFDIVSFWDVLEHVPDPSKTLLDVNRIMKKNGLVFIGIPNIRGLVPLLSYLFYPITNYWWPHELPVHLFQFSKNTLRKILKNNGFEVVNFIDDQIKMNNTYTEEIITEKINSRFLSYFYFRIMIRISKYAPKIGMGDAIICIAKKL